MMCSNVMSVVSCEVMRCHGMRAHEFVMNCDLQRAEQQVSSTNETKQCACHAKCFASLIHIPYATSFKMRRATGINLQPHPILRLPRKIALQNLREISREQLKCHLECAADSSIIRQNRKTKPVCSESLFFLPPQRILY